MKCNKPGTKNEIVYDHCRTERCAEGVQCCDIGAGMRGCAPKGITEAQCRPLFKGNWHPIETTCECKDGWTGKLCDKKPCTNTCVADHTEKQNPSPDCACVCKDGYAGDSCETRINKICPNACDHGKQKPSPDCTCVCHDGWTGKSCNKKSCQERCENGICLNVGDSSICKCNPGFRGKNCDEQDLCYYERNGKLIKKRCDNGKCTNPYSGKCECEPGYSGYFCERDACQEVGGDSYCHHKGECVVDEETHKPTCKCHIGNHFGERCDGHCPMDTYWSDEWKRCMNCEVKHDDANRYLYCDGKSNKDVSEAHSDILYCDDQDCSPYLSDVSCAWSNVKGCPDGYKSSGRDSHGLHWESSNGYNPGNPCYFGSDLRRCEFDHRP